MQHRQCVILQGTADWCRTSSQSLLVNFDNSHIIKLSNHVDNVLFTLPQKQAQQQLGKEFDAVIFDALEGFNPDSFGAIIGTIKAGGVLILLLPQQTTDSLWLTRFKKISVEFAQHHQHFHIIQHDNILPKLSHPRATSDTINTINTIGEQQGAIKAILNVVHGHRRRPLVLSSDRGRGKSAALGMAAAELIKQGKQRIIISAPSLATVDLVFEHAARLLPEATVSQGHIQSNNAEIRFIAPDVLIRTNEKTDCVLVDEAAAIPASMLEQLLQKYSRIVFATTLHGYEGTGCGFAVRFQKMLDEKAPGWKRFRMETPIRWQQGDMLEAFSFQALLLDAVPVADKLILDLKADLCIFEQLDRTQLMSDEQSLRALFGLMLLAHYRTRPSDVQMMLDRDDISLYALRYQGHIVASAWVVNEGPLDEQLAMDLHAGKRRLKGHLLPQSLLAHAGITTAGDLCYQRIIRIAVHPAVQQRGLGKQLLQNLFDHTEKDTDMLGASFGISTELLSFWLNSGFIPARLGIHKDNISGRYAVMMLRSASKQGQDVLNNATQRFQQQWIHLLQTNFRQLDPNLVIAISQTFPPQEIQLSKWDKRDIQAFATGQRGYDFSHISLKLIVENIIRQPQFLQLSKQQQHCCVIAILQQRQCSDITKMLAYDGKKQIISDLRDAISILTGFNRR